MYIVGLVPLVKCITLYRFEATVFFFLCSYTFASLYNKNKFLRQVSLFSRTQIFYIASSCVCLVACIMGSCLVPRSVSRHPRHLHLCLRLICQYLYESLVKEHSVRELFELDNMHIHGDKVFSSIFCLVCTFFILYPLI